VRALKDRDEGLDISKGGFFVAKLRKRNMATIALAASFTLLAAGCGATGGGNNTTGAADNTKPVDGGTLTIGQWQKFNQEFIPLMDSSLYTQNIVMEAFDSLFNIDKNLNFVPWLAKSYQWSSDKKTVTITLRDDANWSDGQPITSDDVLFTMDYLASPTYTNDLQGQYESLVDPVKGSDEILKGKAKSFAETGGFHKISDKQFSITFKSADAAALWYSIATLQPIPKHVLQNIPMKDWLTADYDKMPTVVSGPYKFTKVTTDSVEMEANPNYWAGKPHIQKLVWKTVTPDVAPGMLSSGQLDLYLNGLKARDYENLKKLQNINVIAEPEFGYEYLGWKLWQKELQDVRVRQAIAYAIPRQKMMDGIYKGLGQILNSPIPKGSWAAAPDSELNPYNYDPAKANQLLDEAGWKKGPDGYRIDPVTHQTAQFVLDYPANNPDRASEAQAIAQALNDVGLKVKLDPPMDFNALLKKVLTTNDQQLKQQMDQSHQIYLWIMGWGLSTDPDPRGNGWTYPNANNLQDWNDPTNEALIKKTYDISAFDQNVRKQALIEWQKYFNQQWPAMILYSRPDIVAVSKRVHIPSDDVLSSMQSFGPFINMFQWWVTQQ
jgi:peptide/nickel transport system substrate-binding protein